MIELVYIVAIALCLARAIFGPSFADRVVSLDTASALLIGFIAYMGFYLNLSYLLDIAFVVAILSFIGTIAISLYMKGALK